MCACCSRFGFRAKHHCHFRPRNTIHNPIEFLLSLLHGQMVGSIRARECVVILEKELKASLVIWQHFLLIGKKKKHSKHLFVVVIEGTSIIFIIYECCATSAVARGAIF